MKKMLAYLLTATMTIGMLMGVPAKGFVVEAATTTVTAGGFTLTGDGLSSADYSYDSITGRLDIKTSKQIKLSTNGSTVSDKYIYIGDSSGCDINLTLEKFLLANSKGPAIKIEDNYAGDVTLTLVGNTVRKGYTVNSSSNIIQGISAPAIQKNGTGGGSLIITGTGDLWAESYGTGVAAIGGSNAQSSGNIHINSGIVSAVTYSTGAAIGGGRGGNGSNITISGGDVYACVKGESTTASHGAAIGGGGYGGDGTNITISGGTVLATATASGSHTGSGIGGGHLGVADKVSITGGTVTATGGYDSAGIGAGSEDYYLGATYIEKKNTNITISGGIVTATGGAFYGAGIGSASKDSTNRETTTTVTITGGTIKANGGQDAPGIGAAVGAHSITYISGGSIQAKGGSTATSSNKYTGQDIGFGEDQMDETSFIRQLVYSPNDPSPVSMEKPYSLLDATGFNRGDTILVFKNSDGTEYPYGMQDVTSTDGNLYLYLKSGVSVTEKAANGHDVIVEATSNGTVNAAATAKQNQNFSFTVTPNTGYAISSVSYKVGNGNYQTLTGNNGSYTIPGSAITGTITIKAEFVYNLVSVTKESVTNGTITAATTAEKGKNYTFTVVPNANYAISSVSYKVGNGNYQTLTGNNGSYTIPGSAITGAITIKAEMILSVFSVTKESVSNGTINAASTANRGENYTFTVTPNAGYVISSVSYKVGNGGYQTLTGSNGSYTIPGNAVTDAITIKAEFDVQVIVVEEYAVTTEPVTNGTISAATVAKKGEDFSFTVTPNTNYAISSVSYKVGNGNYQNLTGDNGSYTIPGSAITGAITIKAEMILNVFSVTKESVSNGTINAASTAKRGENYTFTVTPDANYAVSSVSYKIGNGGYQTLTGSNGSYIIPGNVITDTITIRAEMILSVFAVILEPASNGTIKDAAATARRNENYTFTVSADDGYIISEVRYKVGTGAEQVLTANSGSTNDEASYTIPGNVITDVITIKADFADERGTAIDMSGVRWNYSGPYYYKNDVYTVGLEIPDELKDYIQNVTYTNNSQSAIGSYTAVASFTCKTGYYISVEAPVCEWQIVEYAPNDITLKYNGSTVKQQWYNEPVVISADSYWIAESPTATEFLDFVEFANSNAKTLYFKNKNTGYITTAGRMESVQVDQILPTGTISIDGRGYSNWNNSSNVSRYHLNRNAVTISTSDNNGSGVKEAAFIVTDQTYADATAIKNADLNWSTSPSCEIENNKNQRVYVRITDYAGNVTYISSPLIYNDTIAPEITLTKINTTYNSASYKIDFTENSNYAYVLLVDGATAPKDYNAVVDLIHAGNPGNVGKNVSATASFNALSINTSYVLYVAANDGMCSVDGRENANAASQVAKSEFTTSKASIVIGEQFMTVKPSTSDTTCEFDVDALLKQIVGDTYASALGNIRYSATQGNWSIVNGTPYIANNKLIIPIKPQLSSNLYDSIVATVSSDNYEDISFRITIYTTDKKSLKLSDSTTLSDAVYNGVAQGYSGTPVWIDEATNTQVDGLETEITYKGDNYPESTTAPTDAGTYMVTFMVKDNSDYTGSATRTYTIKKATIDMSSVAWYLDNEITAFDVNRKIVNDGQAHKMSVKGYPENLVATTYSRDYEASATGQYTARVDFELYDTNNYETPSPYYMTLPWEIVDEEVDLIVPNMENVGWIYEQDGLSDVYNEDTKLIANDKEYTISIVGLPEGVKAVYDDASILKATQPGDYTATVYFQTTDSTVYAEPNPSSMTLEWSIFEPEVEKITPDMSQVKWVYQQGDVTADYITGITKLIANGSGYTVAVTGLPEGVTPEYNGTYTASESGDYSATVTFVNADETKYNDPNPATMSLEWSIVSAPSNESGQSQIIVPAVGTPKEINGAKYKVTASSSSGGTVEYTGPVDKNASKITIPATVEIDGQIYKVTTIAKDAFKNNKKKLTNVTIKNGILTIGANAFKGCAKLKSITIPSSVISIGANAFNGCKKLSKATIGKNVKTIGKSAFSGCSKLTTVSINSSSKLTKIDDKAFYKCTSLKKITIPKNVTTIGKQTFEGCKNLKTITIKSKKLKKVGSKAIKNIHKKAMIKCPSKTYAKKYKKLFKSKTGYKKTMKIK